MEQDPRDLKDPKFFIFAMSETSSDEEDDPIRRKKFQIGKSKAGKPISGQEKTSQKLENFAYNIYEKVRIQDFQSIQTNYEAFLTEMEKSKDALNVSDRPKLFFKVVLAISEFLEDVDPKTLNKGKVKGFKKLRQTIRKVKRDLEAEFEVYIEDPLISAEEVSFSDDEDEESSSEESSSSSSSSDSDSDSDASGKEDGQEAVKKFTILQIQAFTDDQYVRVQEELTREERREFWKKVETLDKKKKKTSDEGQEQFT